ncbi:transglutaminase family protein [Paraglaciecola sp.]|uniref:transglutaminase-like domain-containing protein n=1 Tax=Paraglaciecola sp. TaxID=1920173 RepID=UPI0030F4574B
MQDLTLTQATPILNFGHAVIASLITSRGWASLSVYDRIGAVYGFVKDEIRFGYNRSDDLTASEILQDGYGQCNTKGTLLMALLRAVGIPCRLHGFTIKQQLQKGAIPPLIYQLTPKYILHSWVEVYFDGRWINLEGFILDQPYLSAIQQRFIHQGETFCGYGVATKCLSAPQVEWQGEDTYIQKEGIHDDYGVFTSPDEFYAMQGTNLSGLKRWLYSKVFRHVINRNVARIRAQTIEG